MCEPKFSVNCTPHKSLKSTAISSYLERNQLIQFNFDTNGTVKSKLKNVRKPTSSRCFLKTALLLPADFEKSHPNYTRIWVITLIAPRSETNT
jgi:hypothetical protein